MNVRHVAVEAVHVVGLMRAVECPHLVRSAVSSALQDEGIFALAETVKDLTRHEEAEANASIDAASE